MHSPITLSEARRAGSKGRVAKGLTPKSRLFPFPVVITLSVAACSAHSTRTAPDSPAHHLALTTHPFAVMQLELLADGALAHGEDRAARCYAKERLLRSLLLPLTNSKPHELAPVLKFVDGRIPDRLLEGHLHWLGKVQTEDGKREGLDYIDELKVTDRLEGRLARIRQLIHVSGQVEMASMLHDDGRARLERRLARGSTDPELETIRTRLETTAVAIRMTEMTLLASWKLSDDELDAAITFWISEPGTWYARTLVTSLEKTLADAATCAEHD